MIKDIHYCKSLEYAVLGACLLEKQALGRTYGIITKNCFYFSDNQAVYETMIEMWNRNIPIDIITVCLNMVDKGIKLAAGNTDWYMVELTNAVVSSANLEYHCFRLNEMWRKREIFKLTQSGTDNSIGSKEQMNLINEKLNSILQGEIKKDWTSMDELMIELLQHHEDIKAGKKIMITTGIKALDKENGGFSPGQMIVIGARPAVGKSSLMGKIALAQAMQGFKVGIISLEMNNVDIASRLTSLDTDIEFWRIHRNLFADQSQAERFYNIINTKTANLPIYISDKTKVDIAEIKAKAAKLKHKHGLDVLMIDYIQLVEGGANQKNQNRENEVSRISRGIKLLAMEMQIPVIVLCQLNRNVTTRKGKDRYPHLSDLRESGSLEQDPDVVLMLHRDWMSGTLQNESGFSTEFEADLLAVKWRNGAMCHVQLEFDPPKMKFKDKSGLIPLAPPALNFYEPSENENDPPF